MKSPIDPKAVPVVTRSPYRRIDPRYPGRQLIATRAQMNGKLQAGAKLADLEALYFYDHDTDLYYLREEHL